jgi:hypothetical protein
MLCSLRHARPAFNLPDGTFLPECNGETARLERTHVMNLQEESFHGTGQMSQGIGSLLVAFIVCFLLLCGTPLCAQSAPDQLTKEKLDMIKELLESGEDINEIGPDGKTPLMAVAEQGDVAVVQYMVEHGARVNDQYGAALMLALSHAHSDVVKYLLEHGADLKLMLAMLNGPTVPAFSKHYLFTSFCLLKPDAVSVAFTKGLTDNDRDYIWSQSVAGLRNIQCNAGTMKLFVERGVDPNKSSSKKGRMSMPATSEASRRLRQQERHRKIGKQSSRFSGRPGRKNRTAEIGGLSSKKASLLQITVQAVSKAAYIDALRW